MKYNFSNFKGKKVLITGDTGFKGSWLVEILLKFQAKVYGIGLDDDLVKNPNCLFNILRLNKKINHKNINLKNKLKVEKFINQIKPDYIFHLAAQSLVIDSYLFPVDTIESNINGTINLLSSIGKLENYYKKEKKNCIILIVTSDKCYEDNKNRAYSETDKLGGNDIYSASKASVEILVNAWKKSFLIHDSFFSPIYCTTVRAGNVIGFGDWSRNRIIPDIIKSLIDHRRLIIRNPKSIRPWQHVLEPLFGYIELSLQIDICIKMKKVNKLNSLLTPFNFGPNINLNYSVIDIVNKIISKTNMLKPIIKKEKKLFRETNVLKVSSNKAKKVLGWKPKYNIDITIDRTLNNYLNWIKGGDPNEIIANEIEYYLSI